MAGNLFTVSLAFAVKACHAQLSRQPIGAPPSAIFASVMRIGFAICQQRVQHHSQRILLLASSESDPRAPMQTTLNCCWHHPHLLRLPHPVHFQRQSHPQKCGDYRSYIHSCFGAMPSKVSRPLRLQSIVGASLICDRSHLCSH